jgi:Immunity protein 10
LNVFRKGIDGEPSVALDRAGITDFRDITFLAAGPASERIVRRRGRSMVRFTANTVVVDVSDEEFILVGFADEQGGAYREALHFQRSYEFDEQDVALGMASVYAERNDQSQGGYGGVERVEVHPDRVRVTVGGPLAEEMGDSEFEITFSLSPGQFERLRDGLRAVFRGFDTLVEHAAEH